MRAFPRSVSLAFAATFICAGAPAHASPAPARHSVALADCPAGTNWNHILMICQ